MLKNSEPHRGSVRGMQNSKGLYRIFGDKLKPQHYQAILFLQYCKLNRLADQTAEEGWGDKN